MYRARPFEKDQEIRSLPVPLPIRTASNKITYLPRRTPFSPNAKIKEERGGEKRHTKLRFLPPPPHPLHPRKSHPNSRIIIPQDHQRRRLKPLHQPIKQHRTMGLPPLKPNKQFLHRSSHKIRLRAHDQIRSQRGNSTEIDSTICVREGVESGKHGD